MSQVIALHPEQERQDLVEHYESMFARASCGTVEGSVDFVNMKGGKEFVSVCGAFADDPALALAAALRAVEFLRARVSGGKTIGPAEPEQIPELLRRSIYG